MQVRGWNGYEPGLSLLACQVGHGFKIIRSCTNFANFKIGLFLTEEQINKFLPLHGGAFLEPTAERQKKKGKSKNSAWQDSYSQPAGSTAVLQLLIYSVEF